MVESIECDEDDDDYDIPLEFIKRMEPYKDQLIEGDIKNYICKNIECIAECVYWKLETGDEEQGAIRDHIDKIPIILECCIYAGRIIKPGDKISKLLVISCLQAILLDMDNDVKYIFYDYQHYKKKLCISKIHSSEKFVLCDALKLYWAYQVERYWYANMGKYELVCKLWNFENRIYKTLETIYGYTGTDDNILDMKNQSEEEYSKFKKILATSVTNEDIQH